MPRLGGETELEVELRAIQDDQRVQGRMSSTRVMESGLQRLSVIKGLTDVLGRGVTVSFMV